MKVKYHSNAHKMTYISAKYAEWSPSNASNGHSCRSLEISANKLNPPWDNPSWFSAPADWKLRDVRAPLYCFRRPSLQPRGAAGRTHGGASHTLTGAPSPL